MMVEWWGDGCWEPLSFDKMIQQTVNIPTFMFVAHAFAQQYIYITLFTVISKTVVFTANLPYTRIYTEVGRGGSSTCRTRTTVVPTATDRRRGTSRGNIPLRLRGRRIASASGRGYPAKNTDYPSLTANNRNPSKNQLQISGPEHKTTPDSTRPVVCTSTL